MRNTLVDYYYGFTFSIDLGSDNVQTLEDVAALLERAAERVRDGATDGKILDMNGNSVGRFEFMKGSR